MAKSVNTFSRRSLIIGTMGTVASSSLPGGAMAKSSEPGFAAKLDAMSEAMEDVHIMEVQSNSFAPHYRKGDLIFVKPETGQPTDHVFLRCKTMEPVFGVLVRRDAKAIYVRGFKASDRLQPVPLNSISEWGRIIVCYRC